MLVSINEQCPVTSEQLGDVFSHKCSTSGSPLFQLLNRISKHDVECELHPYQFAFLYSTVLLVNMN